MKKKKTSSKTAELSTRSKSSSGGSKKNNKGSKSSTRSTSSKKKTEKKTSGKTKKNSSTAKTDADKKMGTVKGEPGRISPRLRNIIIGLIEVAVAIFLFVSLNYNGGGAVGKYIGYGLKGMFGLIALILPFYLAIIGSILLIDKRKKHSAFNMVMSFIMLLLFSAINSGRYISSGDYTINPIEFFNGGIDLKNGGFFGMTAASFIIKFLGKTGLYVFGTLAVIICMIFVFGATVYRFSQDMKKKRLEREAYEAELAELEEEIFKEDEKDVDLLNYRRPLPKSERFSPFSRKKARRSNVVDILTKSDPYAERRGEGVVEEPADPPLPPNEDMPLDKDMPLGKNLPLDKDEEPMVPEHPEPVIDTGCFDQVQEVSSEPERREASDTKLKSEDQNLIDDNIAGRDESAAKNKVAGEDEFKPEKAVLDKRTAEEMAGAAEAGLKKKPSKPIIYKKPPLDLLETSVKPDNTGLNEKLKKKAVLLEETLASFNVDAHVVRVTQGPAVTRYEIQPEPGVKVSKIVGLSDDIALNLRAKSIRMEAPIPGKAAVGIEVQNENSTMVKIREVIGSKAFREAKSKISFVLGKDIAGNNIVADLKEMPHLLIAGSTGSGKSVCINSIITSILYNASPEDVKLVMIDPKVVELGNYNGIPHLLIPVVTDPAKSAAALSWAVVEMTNRYKAFAENGARDLASFNKKMKKSGRDDMVIPQVVIIIDELADLMMTAPSQVEESIARLAQKARAAGMHLIVATQRPSVDIITGLIKANIPSRIAFAVSSQFDSRTILDMGGAEKLLGKGDMLFHPLGKGKPLRVQGTFVSDEEVSAVIDYVKNESGAGENDYSEDVIKEIETGGSASSSVDDDTDELLPDAIECIISEKKASTSLLQRRFRIGYNRAARIMDMMEERRFISPPDGSHPRQVLITEEEYEDLKKDQD